MNLLSDIEKLDYENALSDVFDTFARNIYILKTANTISISANPEMIWLYGNNQAGIETTTQPVSGMFKGSINWGTPDNYNQAILRPAIDGPICQLDLEMDAYEYVKGYDSIIIDGVSCSIDKNDPYGRLHGLFEIRYACLTLRRNN